MNQKITAPLRVNAAHPYFFEDSSTGKAILLAGSHTWCNIQEYSTDPNHRFNFDGHLEYLVSQGFNFTRGWHWEHTFGSNSSTDRVYCSPLPYARTGPGLALDGEPRFDLHSFDSKYFERLRERVSKACERGLYFSVMLFEGWSIYKKFPDTSNPWDGHPFNIANNINGIDGDPEGSGGRAIHRLDFPEITRLQEGYVRHVIDTVNDLPNVLYEIGNEFFADSMEWQCHMIRFIKDYQATKPFQHPVGITSEGCSPEAAKNEELLQTPADWISPCPQPNMQFQNNPPVLPNSGKVIITDTDHLWGLGGNVDWVWKSVTRGHNPILMEAYEPYPGLEKWPHWAPFNRPDHPLFIAIRRNISDALRFAKRMNLNQAAPRPELTSSQYCLTDEKQYLIYIPEGDRVVVQLYSAGRYHLQWLHPQDGARQEETLDCEKTTTFKAPFSPAALFLERVGLD
jgi:hypothetical protein